MHLAASRETPSFLLQRQCSDDLGDSFCNWAHGFDFPHRHGHVDVEPCSDDRLFPIRGATKWTGNLSANRLGHTGIKIQRWQEHECVWVSFELAANTRVFGMNIGCVRHEAGRQRDNSGTDLFAEQRTIRLDVRSCVCVVSVPVHVLADISDPASKVPIEVHEGDFEMRRQKRTDRALAGSTGADQPNLLGDAAV